MKKIYCGEKLNNLETYRKSKIGGKAIGSLRSYEPEEVQKYIND